MKLERVRVGIVAADPLRSLGLETILTESLNVTALGMTLEQAVADKDVAALLLDARSYGETLTGLIERLHRDCPGMKIIAVGESSDPQTVQEVIGAGAKGYLLETSSESEIRMAMEVVLDGSVWAPRKVLARLIESGKAMRTAGKKNDTAATIAEKLTARELDVLRLLMDGRSNREIASAMGIDAVTVKAHLGRMLRKSGASNRVELTLRALEQQNTEQKNAGVQNKEQQDIEPTE